LANVCQQSSHLTFRPSIKVCLDHLVSGQCVYLVFIIQCQHVSPPVLLFHPCYCSTQCGSIRNQ